MAVMQPTLGAQLVPATLVQRLADLGQRLTVLIPVAMVLGLAAGAVVDLSSLKVLAVPMTMLMAYPMMIGFRADDAHARTDGSAIGLAMALNFTALPAVAWGLANAFFRDDPNLYVGMVLAGLFPAGSMAVSWTGRTRGNVPAAVKLTEIGLILALPLAPAYLFVLAGRSVGVELRSTFGSVLLVVIAPMIAGWATRAALTRRLGTYRFQRMAPAFPGLSSIGVLGLVFLAGALEAPAIVQDPGLLVRVAAPIAIFYPVSYLIALAAGRLVRGRGDAVAVVYGTVMRNLPIALGMAFVSFGSQAALILAVALAVQVQSAAWSARFIDRIVDQAPTPATSPIAA